jgi:preprotein translocase subunit SecG
MSTTTMIIIAAIAAIVALVLLTRGSGPRVTQITRTRVREDEEDRD